MAWTFRKAGVDIRDDSANCPKALPKVPASWRSGGDPAPLWDKAKRLPETRPAAAGATYHSAHDVAIPIKTS
jgi:hypothetical protein